MWFVINVIIRTHQSYVLIFAISLSCQIYDIQTGQVTLTLNNTDLANNYKRNCATFNPTDDLVLNDGVLWDVRTAKAIHKFDKFNMNISGVFHPNGLEVIINTEIVSFNFYTAVCGQSCVVSQKPLYCPKDSVGSGGS